MKKKKPIQNAPFFDFLEKKLKEELAKKGIEPASEEEITSGQTTASVILFVVLLVVVGNIAPELFRGVKVFFVGFGLLILSVIIVQIINAIFKR